MTFNTCRLCKDSNMHRPLMRYGIRHYCHAECGFKKWGDEFVLKIPRHEIGNLPFRLLLDKDHPERLKLAIEHCPENMREFFLNLAAERAR